MPTFTPPTDQNGAIDPAVEDMLWKHYKLPLRGLNVWKYTDGTYETTDSWPWVNQAGDGTLTGKVVDTAYYGAHSYPVSSGEAALLTAAGYGAFIT